MKHSLLFLCLFWVCFIQILLAINTHLALSLCVDNQQSLLLQLRRNLNYSSSKSSKLVSWNENLDCCQWVGVHCNSSTGDVIGLDLSSESIVNSSDNLSSLFGLQFLKRLNLAYNSFNTTIPSGIGKLAALTHLNLSNAGFVGQVPLEISQLVNLVTLDLSSSPYLVLSSLKLENPNFSMLIQNLVNLEGLYLNNVPISETGSGWVKALSSSVPDLQYLSLSNCSISGEIDASLEKLKSLSEIHLDQNNLASPVPHFFANFRNLKSLTLSYCQLKGTFPQEILRIPTLKTLDLSYNGWLQGSLPEFPSNSALQTLVLCFTQFSGHLPNSIHNLIQLRKIDLQNCSLSGLIPPSIERLNQLEYVDFSSNKFSGPIPSFSSAKLIIYMKLHNNKLNGTLESTHWSNLTKLVNLDLSTNLLDGCIPKALFFLPSLKTLNLEQNKFSENLKEFSNISLILSSLDLSSNKLDGPIPKSLFELKGLEVLDLSSNNFTGSFNMNYIKNFKNLSRLDLSYNSLSVFAKESYPSGSSFPQLSTLRLASCNLQVLPDFLKNQSKTKTLDLSGNNIRGPIPKWIWKIGNGSLAFLNLSHNSFTGLEQPLPEISLFLSVLDVSFNQIQGEVPTLSDAMPFYLDYSNNNFTSINQNIGKYLVYTAYLSLSKNAISNEIPYTLCNAIHLEVLDLSFNYLNGTIPSCLINKTSIFRVLNLRGNHFSGRIVNNFPKNCTVSTIDVGDNYLQGQIPQSLVNCRQLEVVDFGKNKFHDTFPCWLRGLPNLRVIVLRDNQFYGSVLCKPSSVGWPKLQIVDIASNGFDGELKPEFFKNMTALTTIENPQKAPTPLQYITLTNNYYQNTLEVTFKGLEVNLQKVLTIFMSIDVSNNNFHGNIPDDIGNLRTLRVLNLSNNGFSSSIPYSIGNLTMLESLDFSHNHLNGTIPEELANLNFLGYLNLSSNDLVGRIPSGTQLQSFTSSTYEGNTCLCGPPLHNCASSTPSKERSSQEGSSSFKRRLNWQYILFGSGFGAGAALVIAPVMFRKKWRKWFVKRTDKLVSAILLACGIVNTSWHDEESQADDSIENQLFNINSYNEEEAQDEGQWGRFCVFCTKLDIERKRIIHNPRCTCYDLPSIASSNSSYTSK